LTLAVAVGFKAYPVLFLPFLIAKIEGWKDKIKSLAVFTLTSAAIILPFWSPAFVSSSFASGLTSRILEAGVAISGGERIIIIPAALLLLYLLSWYKKYPLWKYFFAALLVVIPLIHFHTQWLLWVAPFAALYLADKRANSWLVFVAAFAAFAVPLLYDDKFMSVGIFSPISHLFMQISTPFALVQKLTDPYLAQGVLHSIFAGTALAILIGLFPEGKR
jgi:hypothetical protein